MKWLKRIVIALLVIGALVYVAAPMVYRQPQFGGSVEGARLDRALKSPAYTGEKFENKPPQSENMELIKTLQFYMQGQEREPRFPIPVVPVTTADLERPASDDLAAVWLGHASVMVEIGGLRILTDPVLSDVASPFAIGPKRLHPPPISMHELKRINAVLISHDHYDHLDMQTIQALAESGSAFFVPLGVGAHLERWGVDPDQIREMDWWDSIEINSVRIHCTPARHYSGRRRMDNSTLWSSWLVRSPTRSFYFSGDTGYADHFKEIRSRLGPVDLTLMKVGAYGDPEGWFDIHMNPESAVKAQLDLGAGVMLPVHWATFNLAYHAWAEPIERALVAARGQPFKVITPQIGARYEFSENFENKEWWRTR